MNWQEMNTLIQQVSSEMEIDAHQAIESLKKDDILMKRLQELKATNKKTASESADNSELMSGDIDGDIVSDHIAEEDSDEESEEKATMNLIQQVGSIEIHAMFLD